MLRGAIRAIVAALAGAAFGALILFGVYPTRAGVNLEMDRDLPAFAVGFHPIEREGERTFAWTRERVVVRLAGIDRGTDWTCALHVRGPREPGQPSPTLTMSFDGVGGRTETLSNEYRDVAIEIPARPGRPGLVLTANVAPTFVPGPGDPRALGAQVDWVRCTPASRVWPPSAATRAAAAVTGAFALALAVVGASMPLLLVVVAVVGIGVAALLTAGGASFGDYPSLLIVLMTSASALLAAITCSPFVRSRRVLSGAALVAVTVSVVLAALKLAALAHPSKHLVDALFQAHRLDWVLAGRYFFTQPLPDGVVFPYAIGLYVTAAPWASLITDHVLLLRIVVVVTEGIAGALLYALVVRGFQDRLAGVVAVVLFYFVPIPYIVVGNGNLTNAFAQNVALLAMAAVALMPTGVRGSGGAVSFALLVMLTTLAFLSHVSTIMLLAACLGAVCIACLVLGGQELRRTAIAIFVATALASVFAVGLYYRHFGDVIEQFAARVGASSTAAVGEPGAATPAILVRPLSWSERAVNASRETAANIGWPVLVLAGAGAYRLRRAGVRAQIPLMMTAWVIVWVLLLVSGTLTRVDTQYQRYAAEFIGRINLACYPLAAALAGLGAAHLWRARSRAGAAVAMLAMAAAAATAIDMWLGWLR